MQIEIPKRPKRGDSIALRPTSGPIIGSVHIAYPDTNYKRNKLATQDQARRQKISERKKQSLA